MPIAIESRLMPQHLPGSPARAQWTLLEMTPTTDGQSLLWTVDADQQLTLWLPSHDSTTPWRRLNPVLAGDSAPRIRDLALIHNTQQGRFDDTVDIAIVADVGDGAASQRRWFVWNGVTATTDPQVWAQRFEEAPPQDTGELVPEQSHWGQAPRGYRSRCLQGRRPDGQRALWWLRFDDAGQPIQRLLEEIPPSTPTDAVLTVACITDADDRGETREGYARCLVSESVRHGYLTLVWPPTADGARHEVPVKALNGAFEGWGPSEGLWPVTRRTGSTQVYFDTNRGDGGLIDARFVQPAALPTVSTVEAAVVPGHVRTVYRQGEGDGLVRLELTQDRSSQDLLRLTESVKPTGEDGRSTFLEAGVSAFAVCECVQPYGPEAVPPLRVLHVLVGYEEGGLWLLSKDNRSGLWRQRMILDDNAARGVAQVTSQTTSVRVTDDTGAPQQQASVRLRVNSPCHAYINGRSVHLSPVTETVVSTGPSGEFTLIQPTPGFGVPLVDMEVVAPDAPSRQAQINPMQRMVDRMRTVTSGESLRNQPGSDGKAPFAQVPIEKCNLVASQLPELLRAYDGTLPRPTNRPAATRVVQRVVLRRDGVMIAPEISAIDRAPTPEDILNDVGDILVFLATAGSVTSAVTLEFRDNGLAELIVTIGDKVWKALLSLPDQVIDLVHWVLDGGLGAALDDLINWLGQVFDWQAILATHRTLGQLLELARRQAANWLRDTAPGTIAAEMAWAKEALSRLPDLDPATRERLSRAATSGTGQPASSTSSVNGPDAQWGVTTFGNHLGAGTVAGGGHWSTADALADVITSTQQTFASLITNLTTQIGTIDPTTTPLLTVFEDTVALSGAATVDALGGVIQKLLALQGNLIDDVWAQLNQRLDIPVLTSLYEEVIAPGSTASLLDLVLLAAAIAGEIGSRVASGQPLISPAFAEAVKHAPDLASLLGGAAHGAAAGPWTTDVQLVVTLLAGVSKLFYFMAWVAQRSAPSDGPLDKTLVYAKCGFDCAAWAIACAWATVRCAVTSAPAEALKGSVVFLVIDGIICRTKDAVEIAFALRNERPPETWMDAFAGAETLFGGVVLGCCSVYASVAAATYPRVEPSDPDNWNLLLAMPLLQSFGTAIYMGLALPERTLRDHPEFRAARTVVNGIRSTAPLVSMVALGVAARNDWHVPGTIAD